MPATTRALKPTADQVRTALRILAEAQAHVAAVQSREPHDLAPPARQRAFAVEVGRALRRESDARETLAELVATVAGIPGAVAVDGVIVAAGASPTDGIEGVLIVPQERVVTLES